VLEGIQAADQRIIDNRSEDPKKQQAGPKESEELPEVFGEFKRGICLKAVIFLRHKFTCINLNSGVLKMAGGFSDADLEALKAHPENAPLEETQKALLLFVLKVIRTPEQVEAGEVEKLRERGWSDQDIFDAAFHGAAMIGMAKLYKAFSQK